MNANIGDDGIEELFDFDQIDKINVRCASVAPVHVSEDAFEEFELNMVMRIWNVSRADARRYMARRRKEVEALRKRRQAEAERMRPPDFMSA